ncbi:Indole-3-acetic acid-induced protein ARG7 [Ananas comosus]|uniref:Indole-3-acetic acid-induced protein ARG7 n=1 Tax=Ananas comosus TaxID=4615 RepID=A0A199UU81_ANACO|nr:Indole-3-acetic acid-induced protein ARG7 [Ananas comosus]
MGKCSRIRHIVWLRQMLRRWRRRAAAAAAAGDVPAGHVAVRVGSRARRFVVRAAHLNHPAFRQLLRQAEEEFGFPACPGPVLLPCDESLFEHVLRHIHSGPPSSRFPSLVDDLQPSCCFCCGSAGSTTSRAGIAGGTWCAESRPLLQGIPEKPAVW